MAELYAALWDLFLACIPLALEITTAVFLGRLLGKYMIHKFPPC